MAERPSTSLVGTGYANLAARLAELQRKQKEAMLRDNWSEVDRIQAEIQRVSAQAAEAKAQGR